MKVPVIGGVKDGATRTIPRGAEPGVYQEVLESKEQSTTYTLRKDNLVWALVADGMRWPILEAASA